MENKLYIAYGSNLNLPQMAKRCPAAKVVGTSEIKDYALVFRGSGHGAVATIEPCVGSFDKSTISAAAETGRNSSETGR